MINKTYNVSSPIIGPWGVVSYHFSAILLCCRRSNDPSAKRYVDVADVRYDVSKNEGQVGSLIHSNDHSKSQPK